MRELDNGAGVALALNGLGVLHERLGEPQLALMRYEAARESATAQQLATLAASLKNNMMVSYAMLGQLDRAVSTGELSAASRLGCADLTTHAAAELNLSAVHCLRGDQVRALECVDRALRLSHEGGDRLRICEALIVRCEANLRLDDLRKAYADAGLARSEAEASGYGYALAVAEGQRSRILSAMGRTGAAAQARCRSQAVLTGLTDAYRDPLIELLLA